MIQMENQKQNKHISKKFNKVSKIINYSGHCEVSNLHLNHSFQSKLLNSPKKSQLKLDRISAKIFWEKNAHDQSTIQKITSKKKTIQRKPLDQFDIFSRDKKKYESIHQMNLKVNQMCLPIVRKPSTYKQKSSQKQNSFNSYDRSTFDKNQSNRKNIRSHKISEIVNQYRQRCKNQIEQFNFLFAKHQPLQERSQKKHKHSTYNSLHSNNYLPKNLVDIIKVKKGVR